VVLFGTGAAVYWFMCRKGQTRRNESVEKEESGAREVAMEAAVEKEEHVEKRAPAEESLEANAVNVSVGTSAKSEELAGPVIPPTIPGNERV